LYDLFIMKSKIEKSIIESSDLIKKSSLLTTQIEKSITTIVKCLQNGNKIILFGNGGSAADAQHIAAEFVGRFKLERNSFPALALTDNSSTITALSNDYSFNKIFSRQCESFVTENDVVIAISTSGNSSNVISGVKTAKKKNAIIIGLLGNKGGKMKKIVDIPIIVSSSSTPKIQEVHRVIYHIICDLVEKKLVRE